MARTDDKELLENLTASALNGIIANQETMREITKIVQDNPKSNIDFYSVIAEMAVKYAQSTVKILNKSLEN